MPQLPEAFETYTHQLMGEERYQRYLLSFEEETPVSIRLNPLKSEGLQPTDGIAVPWCREGYYLPERPNFTMDPLLHAGCYYVQEAASMFLDEVLRQLNLPNAVNALDLCAAPGGKSTLLRAALPEGSVLYSNEPMRQRAHILAENVQKWGAPNHIVTNNYPRDYRKARALFDLILCDVPCSGEGMFRKDEATIREWSPQQMEKCGQLQRDIVDDAWQCLRNGGYLIYSTCTFNTKENEENIRYFLEQYDAQVVAIDIQPEWHIIGSLLDGFSESVYRFIPGITRSEGLFLCVLQKGGDATSQKNGASLQKGGGASESKKAAKGLSQLNVIADTNHILSDYPRAELSYPQAISYLRHEALTLPPDTPRGLVTVCFLGHPLGLVKNIGQRANNLYPKEWKIKTTHISNSYEAILRHP